MDFKAPHYLHGYQHPHPYYYPHPPGGKEMR